MDHGENSVTVTSQEFRKSVIALSWLQHVHSQIAEAARGAPGFNGYSLAAVLPFESEVAILTYAGKTELGPALQWVVQGFHQPGDTVNSLIEFRKLRQASAGDDGAHNKTAQQSHLLCNNLLLYPLALSEQPKPISFSGLEIDLVDTVDLCTTPSSAKSKRAGLTRTRGMLLPIIHRVTKLNPVVPPPVHARVQMFLNTTAPR